MKYKADIAAPRPLWHCGRIVLIAVATIVLSGQPMAGQARAPGKPADRAAKGHPSAEARAAAQTAFTAGTKLQQDKKYAEAVVEYRKADSAEPENPSTLWNLGMSAYLAKDYSLALSSWRRLKALDPTEGTVRAKLIVVYQAMGNRVARARERAELVALRNSKRDPDLAAKPSYCCDQFVAAGKDVFAYDFFELKGDHAVRYSFLVLKADGTTDFRISLGSYKDDNELAHELGQLKAGERVYFLDGYYDGGKRHSTFAQLNGDPGYDAVKKMIIAVLEGKLKPISSSVHP